jgi:hypothetical protein
MEHEELDFLNVTCCELNRLGRDVGSASYRPHHRSKVDTPLHILGKICFDTASHEHLGSAFRMTNVTELFLASLDLHIFDESE